ncbi:MAG: DUF3800 domain-containing protein [Sphingorhabdus sp.]
MPIYCDESGGVGRGVMTLAAIDIDEDKAEALIARFRLVTSYHGEVKGSRIDLAERALLFEMINDAEASVSVGIAISALVPEKNADRGDHDIEVYAALLEDVVAAMLPEIPGCDSVIIDDGRYGPETLAAIRTDIAKLVGPCGTTQLEHSHRLAGLQIADVIANTFYNRALVTERQGRIAAIAAPMLESGKIKMRVLGGKHAAES